MRQYGWKIVVLIILAVFVFFWLVKAPIIASYLTRKMGVNVSIGSISIWPSQTSMHNFRINNPKGFKTKAAFKAAKTKIDYVFKNLLADPTEIDLIELDDVYLSIEFLNPLGTSNNWTAIGANMPESNKPGKEVLIHKLVVNNTNVDIRGMGLLGKNTTKTIPRMEFYEIDSKEGFPTKQLIQIIFGGAGLQQYIQDVFNPQKVLQKYLPFGLGSENEPPAEPEKKEAF